MTLLKLNVIAVLLFSILSVALYFQQKDQAKEAVERTHDARIKAYQKANGGYGHVGSPYKKTP